MILANAYQLGHSRRSPRLQTGRGLPIADVKQRSTISRYLILRRVVNTAAARQAMSSLWLPQTGALANQRC